MERAVCSIGAHLHNFTKVATELDIFFTYDFLIFIADVLAGLAEFLLDAFGLKLLHPLEQLSAKSNLFIGAQQRWVNVACRLI